MCPSGSSSLFRDTINSREVKASTSAPKCTFTKTDPSVGKVFHSSSSWRWKHRGCQQHQLPAFLCAEQHRFGEEVAGAFALLGATLPFQASIHPALKTESDSQRNPKCQVNGSIYSGDKRRESRVSPFHPRSKLHNYAVVFGGGGGCQAQGAPRDCHGDCPEALAPSIWAHEVGWGRGRGKNKKPWQHGGSEEGHRLAPRDSSPVFSCRSAAAPHTDHEVTQPVESSSDTLGIIYLSPFQTL